MGLKFTWDIISQLRYYIACVRWATAGSARAPPLPPNSSPKHQHHYQIHHQNSINNPDKQDLQIQAAASPTLYIVLNVHVWMGTDPHEDESARMQHL